MQQLLEIADVVALQEVPCALIERIVGFSSAARFQAQWVAAPSRGGVRTSADGATIEVAPCRSYATAAGKRGCSTEKGGLSAALPLPPTAHDMLLVRFSALKEPPAQLLPEAPSTNEPAGSSPSEDVAPSSSAESSHAPAEQADDVLDSWEDL